MASKVTYLRYPPQAEPAQDTEGSLLAAFGQQRAKADDTIPVNQPDVTPPVQQDFPAQIQTPPPPATQVIPAMPPEDPETSGLRHLLRQQFETGMQKQEASADQLGELAKIQAQHGQNIQTDLSPTMNFVSQLTGVDINKGYTPPVTAEAKRKELLDMLQANMKGQDTVSDNKIGLLKTMLESKHAGDTGRQARFDQAQNQKIFASVQKQQENLAEDYSKFNQQAQNVSKAFTPDSNGMVEAGRLSIALSQFARMMGEKGVLTEGDTKRVMVETMDKAAADFKNKFKPGQKIPADQVQSSIRAFNDAIEAFKDSHKLKAGSFAAQFTMPGSPYANLPFAQGMMDQANNRVGEVDKLKIPFGNPVAGLAKSAGQQPAVATGQRDMKEAAMAEIQRRAGAK